MTEYKYSTSFFNRYALNLLRRQGETFRFTSQCDLRYEVSPVRCEAHSFQNYLETGLFLSDAYSGQSKDGGSFHCRSLQFKFLSFPFTACSYQSGGFFSGTFNARSLQRKQLAQQFSAASYRGGGIIRFSCDFLIEQKNGIVQCFDSLDEWTSPRTTGFCWSEDFLVAVRHRTSFPFKAVSRSGTAAFSFGYDFLKLIRERLGLRFNAIPCDFLFRQFLRWASVKKEFAGLPVHSQALVRSGWRILARNLLTDDVQELGFIDTENPTRSLTDIFLPDGDYEISVLTSSLFWKDAADRNIRTISIHEGIELSPLPLIYNLRSAISQGVTIIQWSANQSEVEDCVFGLWYSAESPVDTERPPDATVWYAPTQTEYQTTFNQNAPSYAAVAVLRTGNETERGKIHELSLDWHNTPPRAPDDVIVFDKPLPAFDAEIQTRQNEEFSLWQ